MDTQQIGGPQSTPPASPQEAAAIAAALEEFLRETSPVPQGSAERLDPWTRAAMLEGVSREDQTDVPHLTDVPHPWINT